jgi:hypothetical protein
LKAASRVCSTRELVRKRLRFYSLNAFDDNQIAQHRDERVRANENQPSPFLLPTLPDEIERLRTKRQRRTF